jgi:hypothetical protein
MGIAVLGIIALSLAGARTAKSPAAVPVMVERR